jgi:branched-chain amino acid transport system substrate-binding protein
LAGRAKHVGQIEGELDVKMNWHRRGLIAATILGLTAAQAQAADKLKVGLLVSLSEHGAVTGGMIRDGFMLAVKQLGGKLGGRDVDVIVADDEIKPDVAVSKAMALVERDKVDFVVGPIFSNILLAILKPVTDSGAFLISPNPGPSNLAGAACNPNFFATSYQNDQVHEVVGKYAHDAGLKKVVLLAPNYQAGKDALTGFKRGYQSEAADEVYVPLGTMDFSAELAKIAAEQPDAVFVFLPGGMGINFVKQFRQAGLADKVKFLSAFTVDEATLPAQKDAAVGLYGGSNWAPNLDTPQNKAFVAAYEKAYGIVPASYAFEAYDAALLIDGALKETKGSTADKDALRAALKKAPFTSLRGSFKFNNNHFPIQDFYLVKVAKRADGKFETEIAQKVFTDFGDAYAKNCKMK